MSLGRCQQANWDNPEKGVIFVAGFRGIGAETLEVGGGLNLSGDCVWMEERNAIGNRKSGRKEKRSRENANITRVRDTPLEKARL